jgi:hypothetical protein
LAALGSNATATARPDKVSLAVGPALRSMRPLASKRLIDTRTDRSVSPTLFPTLRAISPSCAAMRRLANRNIARKTISSKLMTATLRRY